MDFNSLKVGDAIPPLTITMDRGAYFKYNELVNERNPLHFDVDFARSLGFDDIVVAGVYTYSFIPRMVAQWLGRDGAIKGLTINYVKPAYIDKGVTYSGEVIGKSAEGGEKIVNCRVKATDEGGTTLINASLSLDLS